MFISFYHIYHSFNSLCTSCWMLSFFNVVNYALWNTAKGSSHILCLQPSEMNEERMTYTEVKLPYSKKQNKRHPTNKRRGKVFFLFYENIITGKKKTWKHDNCVPIYLILYVWFFINLGTYVNLIVNEICDHSK